MKKLFRALLCTGLMAALLSIPAFALRSPLPETPQGAFYVVVNGEPVTFSDAVPQMKDDRSCLPFVAVFDQLGFAEEDMHWDSAARTVTATKDGTTIQLTIDSNEILLWHEGETITDHTGTAVPLKHAYTADVAPYISGGRTYIPFGIVADLLGYHVGWDGTVRAVIIDDVDAIMAANNETYTLMDQYLDYGRSLSQGNMKVSGSYAADLSMDVEQDGESLSFRLDLDGKYDEITANSTALQFDTDLKLDMSMKANGQDVTDAALGEAAGLFPMALDMELRGDADTGVFYFQSAALSQLMGQPGLTNTWYKMDLAALFGQMSGELGVDYADLLGLAKDIQNMSYREYLARMLKEAPVTSVSDDTWTRLAMLDALFADRAFTKSGSNYVNKLDLGQFDPSLEGCGLTFTLYTSGGKVNGYGLDMAAAMDEMVKMDMTAQVKGKKMDIKMTMDVTDQETTALTFTLTMDGTYQPTSAKPAAEPPAGAAVVDLMELLGSYVPMPLE